MAIPLAPKIIIIIIIHNNILFIIEKTNGESKRRYFDEIRRGGMEWKERTEILTFGFVVVSVTAIRTSTAAEKCFDRMIMILEVNPIILKQTTNNVIFTYLMIA